MNEFDDYNTAVQKNGKARFIIVVIIKALLLAASVAALPLVYFYGIWVGGMVLGDAYVSSGVAAAIALFAVSALSLASTVVDYKACKLQRKLSGAFSLKAFGITMTVINILFPAVLAVCTELMWSW